MVRRRKETSRTAPWMILPIIMFIATCLAASLVWLSPGDRDLQLLQSTAPRDIAQWFRCGEDGGEHALQCFVRAIQESRPLLEAYNNVAASLRQGQRTPVGLSSVDCRAHAVTLMTHVQKAWHSVGRSLPASSPRVTIDQMEYSQSDCYLSYLRLEPEISKAWLMLGKDLPHGETKVQRLVPRSRGGAEADFEVVDALKCFLWALHYDPTNSLAWYHVALVAFPPSRTDPTVTVNGKNYTFQQCLVEALRIHKPLAVPGHAWSMLEATLREGETITVGDDEYSKKDLIELGPKEPKKALGFFSAVQALFALFSALG